MWSYCLKAQKKLFFQRKWGIIPRMGEKPMVKVCKYSEELGRSMVEMLGVLAIVGVLSLGGVLGYTKAMAKHRVDATLNQVSILISTIRSTFGYQPTYEGLNNESAIKYGFVEKDLIRGNTSGSTLTNAYNKPVNLLPASTKAANDSFTLEYQGLPPSACVTIAIADWGGTGASGLVSIKIEGASGEKTFTWTGEDRLPITFDTAKDACDDPNGNTITWTYF